MSSETMQYKAKSNEVRGGEAFDCMAVKQSLQRALAKVSADWPIAPKEQGLIEVTIDETNG